MAVTKEEALEALDSLDDFARMEVGVDASGPREVLRAFIEGAKAPIAAGADKGRAGAAGKRYLYPTTPGYGGLADAICAAIRAERDEVRDLLEHVEEFLGELPADLGKDSLNGLKIQLSHKLDGVMGRRGT